MAEETARLKMYIAIKQKIYRGKPGFLIYGTNARGQRINIFAEDHSAAEHIRTKVKKGEQIDLEDFAAQHRNPSGSGVRIVFNKLLSGWYIVRGPHQTPLGGRFDSREQAEQHLIDEKNRRDQRGSGGGKYGYLPGERNPSLRTRGGAPVIDDYRRGVRRRLGRMQLGLTDAIYHVQVRRGKTASSGWLTLGAFKVKATALEYGRALAHKYSRKVFRVHWPDEAKKNPARPATFSIFRAIVKAGIPYDHHESDLYVPVTPESSAIIKRFPHLARNITRFSSEGKQWFDIPFAYDPFWEKRSRARKKNPAPRARADGAKVAQASKLFRDFTGHSVTKVRQVRLPSDNVGLAIGPVLAVAYSTTRDGKREKYMHEFRRGARPLLAASHDGRALYLLSGAYRFTERGIVDKG